jgi:hypothetical protein
MISAADLLSSIPKLSKFCVAFIKILCCIPIVLIALSYRLQRLLSARYIYINCVLLTLRLYIMNFSVNLLTEMEGELTGKLNDIHKASKAMTVD